MGRAKELAGQVVVITGAARGLGALVARRLAARNAQVALLGLEPEELASVSASCGPRSRWWEVDVTDERALADIAAGVLEAYERIDVVVANAGIAIGGPFIHSEAGSFTRVIEVNLLGSVATARAFLPALVESKGYLLQVASLAALAPSPMMAAYCASKAGVEAFAHSVRAEVAHHGVGIGVAYLSWTDTDMVRGADADPALREMRGECRSWLAAQTRSRPRPTPSCVGSPGAHRTCTGNVGCHRHNWSGTLAVVHENRRP